SEEDHDAADLVGRFVEAGIQGARRHHRARLEPRHCFMVEIAKLNGGSETNIEPAFEAIKKLLPNVGAIAASPGALAALFQQGEIDIAFNFWNNVALLAAKGVDIAFAKPKSGAVVIRTSAQIVKNNQDPKLVLDYLDTVMSVDTQKGIE
ncbi:ABC transporter substrate-binding protein, partial [Xanthomonas citri pv. citri]